MSPLIVQSMWGLGDSIYQRPFVRALGARFQVWLETPWPEVYAGLPVQLLHPRERSLRTQTRNIRRQPEGAWSAPRQRARLMRLHYARKDLERHNVAEGLRRAANLSAVPGGWDLPSFPAPAAVLAAAGAKPIAMVRPVTVRAEWRNEARNPRPEYIVRIAARLMATHHVVAVADLAEGAEWLQGDLPAHHQAFLAGELVVEDLLGLVAAADIVVGGVGWIVPAAIASRARAFIVLGGHGAHNAPGRITHPTMDLSRIAFAMPDRYCRCVDMRHACDKTISNLDAQFDAFAAAQDLARAAVAA